MCCSFEHSTSQNGREVRKCEGPDYNHTVLVEDINIGGANSTPENLTAVGDVLFFSATNGTNGIELWKCEGPDYDGAVMVEDGYPGPTSSSPAELTAVDDVLFLTGNVQGMSGHPLLKCEEDRITMMLSWSDRSRQVT